MFKIFFKNLQTEFNNTLKDHFIMKKMLFVPLSDYSRMKVSGPGTKNCNGSLTRGKEKEITDVIKGWNSNCGLSGLLDNKHNGNYLQPLPYTS